mmetsp:Transcript_16306/g.28528  ORF Transcript_16306/g.28528 Transcript_16306/m.28528 type:complete len:531 (-) Transcript_16306:77-1669(-)
MENTGQESASSQTLKRKRSTADFVRARRQGVLPSGLERPPSEELLLKEDDAPVKSFTAESLDQAFGDAAVENAREIEVARMRAAQFRKDTYVALEQAAQKPDESLPQLDDSKDMNSDLNVQNGLRLTTTHASLRWLRRLPTALRCQSIRAQDLRQGAVREAALELCGTSLPGLLTDPDKAASWLARVASCLSWYEAEGPMRPPDASSSTSSGSRAAAAPSQEKDATKKVEDWDEAYRSLLPLLRQGQVPCFAIMAERFSVEVFGEGSLPVEQRGGEDPEPVAVLWPSSYELREMLQENHVHFEMASEPAGTQDVELRPIADIATGGEAALSRNGTLATPGPKADAARADLRELRRDGEKALAPEDLASGKSKAQSSALYFKGAWRVHALVDVLRQYFLSHPLPGGPKSPGWLPLLVAPTPFANATVRSADVAKTMTSPATASAGAASGADAGATQQHMAELTGRFFPAQLEHFLKLLRVLLPSFSCEFTLAPRHTGCNVFTRLGSRRIEAVLCERVSDTAAGWKWSFRLG